MEARYSNYLVIEVNSVIDELDQNQLLSPIDKLELKDHFFSEIDRLHDSGLNDEEALVIAKKRFGLVDEIKEEYEKVRPKFDLLRYGIIGVVAYCLIKSFALLINLSSQVFWLVAYQFKPEFVLEYALLDIYVRLFLIFFLGFFAGKFITKLKFKSLSSLWFFPIAYLILEVANRLFGLAIPMAAFCSDIQLLFDLVSNSWIVNGILLVFIMIFASYKMYKMKVWEMEYV